MAVPATLYLSAPSLQYWSVTEGGWRTLITSATALDGPDLEHRHPDFTLAARNRS